MQLVEGSTLEERWETLSTDDRVDICRQLSHMVKVMRRLEQCLSDRFVGLGGQVRSGSGSIYRGSWKRMTCMMSGTT